jgi:hypothetical protein
MTFQLQLRHAFAERRRLNRRYTLRTFARSLRTDHSALSRLMDNKRRLTPKSIRTLAPRLGFKDQCIAEFCALENEAAILRSLTHPRFRPDCRWLAMALNIPIDDVNIALQRLLRKGAMAMNSRRQWRALGERNA